MHIALHDTCSRPDVDAREAAMPPFCIGSISPQAGVGVEHRALWRAARRVPWPGPLGAPDGLRRSLERFPQTPCIRHATATAR